MLYFFFFFVLTVEGEEGWRRKPAAVILIACLPPGYGSEIEPRKKMLQEEFNATSLC